MTYSDSVMALSSVILLLTILILEKQNLCRNMHIMKDSASCPIFSRAGIMLGVIKYGLLTIQS